MRKSPNAFRHTASSVELFLQNNLKWLVKHMKSQKEGQEYKNLKNKYKQNQWSNFNPKGLIVLRPWGRKVLRR